MVDFDVSTSEGQRRLMALSVGDPEDRWLHKSVQAVPAGADYGADPIGDGMHRMVPSGDIVTLEERMRRLERLREG